MGLVNGSEVTLERTAPLGDPIEIRVKGYDLSLRKELASQIEVECLNTPLFQIPPGQTVTVSVLAGTLEDKRHLSDMGLTPGTQIRLVENHHPGPILIDLRGSRLILGHEQAEQVMVVQC
jgi:Fe2+ transport system protein FeoA